MDVSYEPLTAGREREHWYGLSLFQLLLAYQDQWKYLSSYSNKGTL